MPSFRILIGVSCLKIKSTHRLKVHTMMMGLVKAEAPKEGHLSANTARGMIIGPIVVEVI